MATKQRVGWYRLPSSGQPFYGVIPPGAKTCRPPKPTSATSDGDTDESSTESEGGGEAEGDEQ